MDFYKYIQRTPTVKYTGDSNGWQSIWIKDETQQHTRAFKFRGNVAKLSKLPEKSQVVTASTGNHGLGLARAARLFNLSATVFIPATTPRKKSFGIEQAGAKVICIDGDYDSCEQEAKQFSTQIQGVFISSFDDEEIIKGHQTICEEIDEERVAVDTIFVPVGGGGLISACLNYWREGEKKIIGVEAATAPAMKHSLEAGYRVRIQKTSGPAEGLLVRQVGQIPFLYCLKYRLPIKTVDFEEMENAVRNLWINQNIRAETAGAASLAAALKNSCLGKNCLCIITGGNIDDSYFEQILNMHQTKKS